MKLIHASASLWRAFNELTAAAQKADALSLMEAAVMFTTQLALASRLFAATERDQAEVRSLESDLISTLKTWRDDEGAMKLRLMTYDVECVVGDLARAAQRYACPQRSASDADIRHAVKSLPRSLTIAAVAFTIQLALEKAERDAAALRSLERAMISALGAPWEPFDAIPLSVDVQDGPSWEPLKED